MRDKVNKTIVIIVLIACAVTVLFLLSQFARNTGLAIASGTPNQQGVISLMQDAQLLKGSGTMKCSYACARQNQFAIAASVDGQTAQATQVLRGEWSCLCAGIE